MEDAMSISEHYHIQGAVGFDQIGGVTYEGHNVIYHLVLKEKRIKCSKCGNTHVHKRGTAVRLLRAESVGHRKDIFSHATIPRVHCAECGIIRQDDARNEIESLERVLSLNTPLTTGYVLKESLRQIWMKGEFEEALLSLTGFREVSSQYRYQHFGFPRKDNREAQDRHIELL
jgi:ribosomal protein S27E